MIRPERINYEGLIGPKRREQPGYIYPRTGQFTTYTEVDRHLDVLLELEKIAKATPNPEAKDAIFKSKADFVARAEGIVAKRNQASGQ